MAQIYDDKPVITTIEQIKTLFKTPPVEYRSAPLWVWNDDITKEKIEQDLTGLKAQGVWGAFIHPRPGLITPYLSPEWFNMVRFAVDKGKELGMHIWLYDENSYPSGFAGGNVPAEMPESYNEGQGLVMHHTDILPDDVEKYFIIQKKADGKFLDITNQLQKEKNQNGDYYFFEKIFYENRAWHGGYSYVDLLYKGVTEKFIEITMDKGYKKAIGDEFGKTVPGIFTDEPNINPPGDTSVRWTPDLFSKFQEHYGYDLKTQLAALWVKSGDWRKVRYDYYNLLLNMFINRWSKPWYNYCETNNLKWTGHYWEHGWPKLDDGPDNMAMYAWHQQPAIDLLMNQYKEDVSAQFGNVRSVKELRSVANQLGQNRTLSETYGAGGWELRLQDMKRIGDWEYVLGVNFLNQHLTYMTIQGARKRDHPQSFSYHAPWWQHYHLSADYFARLSLVMSAGEQYNSILVLEPTTTSWIHYTKMPPDNGIGELGANFQQFLVNLEKLQIEYDLGCEDIIKNNGKVSSDNFIIGKRSYNLLIIPPGMENFSESTVKLLKKYLTQGGEVLSFAGIPAYINGVESTEMNQVAQKYSKQWHYAVSASDKQIRPLLETTEIRFYQPENIKGILFHHRRQLKNGEMIFLVNTSDHEWSTGSFQIKGKSVQELNLVTGETTSYPGKKDGAKLMINFDLPPVGSLLLHINNSGSLYNEDKKEISIKQIKPEKLTAERLSPNVLTLDFCDFSVGDITQKDIYCNNASNIIFKEYGFDGNPWSQAVQFKEDIIRRNNFPKESGFKADFNFVVADGVDLSSLQAVIEKPLTGNVLINGHEVKALQNTFWLDKDFVVFNISEKVTPGKNKITVIVKPMSVFAELEPIYIRGNFNLESKNKGWEIVPAREITMGSWKTRGLPFYTDSVKYSQSYTINPKQGKHYIIKPTHWQGTVSTVKVNGKNAGIIYTPPYELDITHLIKKGKNEIALIITGSLKNLLGPHHAGAIRGSAWPAAFHSAPGHLPIGFNYDLIDYGLFREFFMIESNGTQNVYLRNYDVSKPVIHFNNQVIIDSSLSLTITCDTEESEIRYTTNGSTVNKSSSLYKKEIVLKKSAGVKARAYKKGLIESDEIQQAFFIVDSKKNGIKYDYYSGNWSKLPDFSKEKKIKSGQVYTFNLVQIAKHNSNFGIVFNSYLQIDEDGTYNFFTNSNDGTQLFIDDKLIVNNDGLHGMNENQGQIVLNKGLHSIRLHYFDGGGSQGLEVSYQSKNIEKQIIPANKFFISQ